MCNFEQYAPCAAVNAVVRSIGCVRSKSGVCAADVHVACLPYVLCVRYIAVRARSMCDPSQEPLRQAPKNGRAMNPREKNAQFSA